MKFLERYREERQKKGGTINLQFMYLPEEHQPSYAGILKQVAPSVFRPNPDRNALVIQAPFLLGGLDLPHFNYWVVETGNYFDGFRQHCATSGNGQPLSQENLNLVRNNYEVAYENDFQGLAWEFNQKEGHERFEGQEYASMLAVLYVLDQLPKEKSVNLAVQPVTTKDLGSFVIRNRKLIWGKELSGQELKPTEDVDEYLQANKPDIVEYYSRLGKATGDKVLPFVSFVNRTLDEGLQTPGNTNMLVLMDEIGHPLSHIDFQNRADKNPSIKLAEAAFLNCGGYYADIEQELTVKYLKDPKAGLTEDELTKITAHWIIVQALEAMPGNWYSGVRKSMVPKAIGRSTRNELRALIKLGITPDTEDEYHESERFKHAPEEIKEIMREVFRTGTTNVEKIVDMFSEKAGSIFTFNPWQP